MWILYDQDIEIHFRRNSISNCGKTEVKCKNLDLFGTKYKHFRSYREK